MRDERRIDGVAVSAHPRGNIEHSPAPVSPPRLDRPALLLADDGALLNSRDQHVNLDHIDHMFE